MGDFLLNIETALERWYSQLTLLETLAAPELNVGLLKIYETNKVITSIPQSDPEISSFIASKFTGYGLFFFLVQPCFCI